MDDGALDGARQAAGHRHVGTEPRHTSNYLGPNFASMI